MKWLLHNPIADMYGPYFLAFYALVIGLTLVCARALVRRQDWTSRMPLPPVPSTPDPYEIAYLRGGEAEVARAAVFALVQKNFLQLTEDAGKTLIERTGESPGAHELPQLERRVLEWFRVPRRASEVLETTGLLLEIRGGCQAYEQKLRRENFLMPPESSALAFRIWLGGALVIVGLGAYKMFVALAKGRTNLSFLVLLGIAGVVLLWRVSRASRKRLSRRGQDYLDRLQLAFARLKDTYNATARAARGVTASTPNAATGAIPHASSATPFAASASAFDPSLTLLVGLFGVGALAGTPYEPYRRLYASPAAYDVTGASAASGGSDGGSSCGGGCGGGGCGGCGS